MTLHELITELSNRGVTLSAEGEQLRIRAQKGVLTPELKEQLSERKNDILMLLQKSDAETGMIRLPVIVPAPEKRYEPFPLTEIQQAYWIGRGQDFELGNVATHAYVEIENKGLDLVRLGRAWQQLIDRHDMLRAVVLPSGEQKVLKEVPPYEIKILDLRGRMSAEVSSQLQAVRDRMSHQVLSADQWPLFEIRASRMDDRVRLHISLDLLIADLWSLLRLFDEWHQLYDEESDLMARPDISFRDYVLTEQGLHESELYQRSRDYWLKRSETLAPAPELPLHRNPGSITKPRFVRRSSHLNKDAWQRLKRLATQAGLTPSGVLLAAFSEVLMYWSKSARFTINMTLFNRLPLHPQVNELIGDFTTTILLEVDNASPEPFVVRARKHQNQLWKDLDHRYFNGVLLLREMTQRHGSYASATMPIVFTSALGLDSLGEKTEKKAFSGNGRKPFEDNGKGHGVWEHFHHFGEVVYGITQTPQVWLDHQILEEDGELVFNWDSVDELFPEGLLDDMFKAYGDLLNRLAISDAAWQETGGKLIPAYQLSQRESVNETSAPVSGEMLHTLFASQVKKHGAEYAVISGRRSLTYRELFSCSNQAAHRLRRLGAVPNTLVAVVMEKGWEQVVAVLGVLQSGAAYLPIDPDLPLARRIHLLESSRVRLVLTQSNYDRQLEWPEGIQRICVDNEDLSAESVLPLPSVQRPGDLAYVIYTSGSTGLPKGVMIDHRGAVNTILDINRRFAVGPRDRVLALSALSFDLSVYDIFGLLAAGGALVIPDAEASRDASHWADLMVEHEVTLWNTVPALMQMLVEYVSGRADKVSSSLKQVMMSGDWIPSDLPDRIKGLWPDIRVFSLGGATEASIWSIYYPIESVDPAWKSIPYGKPLSNQSFHVLNDFLEPCPVWVPGQLYIGGIGLAKGFWQDEKKTQASFLVHPKTGERLYKTGDLGRYLPDGNIEFLGREDFQVKVNGYRIELGEIEAALKEHPAVRDAIASAVGEEKGSRHLVAYVVPNPEQKQMQETTEDYGPRFKEGVILDYRERTAFKLQQQGIRKPDPGQRDIPLARPPFDEETTRAYLERQSFREYLETPVPLDRLSRFLSCLLQWKPENAPLPKYRYPSAGSLYPVQTYLYVKPDRVEDLPGGVYYYHPGDHKLVLLNGETRIDTSVYSGYGGTNQKIFEQCGFALYLIGRLDAIAPLYGDWARDFCILEAGYMGQLLSEAAPREEIGLCAIGDLMFDDIRRYFDLEPSHILAHSFLGGRIDPTQREKLSSQTLSVPETLDTQLRSYLRGRIPEYMVPAHYVMLDSLPLSANGKVDRKALPKPDFTQTLRKGDDNKPRTPLEENIASIFSELFEGAQVGKHDSFFELGGDSLLATQLISRVRAALGIELTMRNLFDSPTVAGVAEYIETAGWATQCVPEKDLSVDERDEVEF